MARSGQAAGGAQGTGPEPGQDEALVVTEFSTLLSSLGFSDALCNWITRKERLIQVLDLLDIHRETITTIFSRIAKEEIHYTGSQDSKFRALHHYTRRMFNQNIPINPTIIDRNLLIQEMELMESEQNTKGAGHKVKEEPLIKLTRDTRWRSFKYALMNFLDGIIGKKGIPLTYVIRPLEIPPGMHNDPMYTASLHGHAYNDDNHTVFRHIWGAVLGDQYEVYVKEFAEARNGRGAFFALEMYFNGGAYQIHKVNAAWKVIQSTKYTGRKSSMDFTTYRRLFDEAWADLKEANQEPNGQSKVRWLLEGMVGEDLKVAKATITNDEQAYTNYELACLKLSRLVANDDVLDKGVKERQMSSVNNERNYIPSDEWRKLSPQEQAAIQRSRPNSSSRRRGRRYNNNGGRGRGGNGGNDSNRHKTGGNDMTRGSGRSDDGQASRKGRGGRRVRFNVESKTIYPHSRTINKIKSHSESVYAENDDDYNEYDEDSCDDDYVEPGGTPSQKFRRMSGIRRISRIVQEGSDSDEVRVELDSHADNGVLGSDAVILEEYPDEIFKVYGYRKENGYVEMTLVKAALAYDKPNGTTTILVFDKVFIDQSLRHSLINPNQIRDRGHIVDDVAVRFGGKHAIVADELTIPLYHHGCMSYFPARRPTEEELCSCDRIDMHGEIWDPNETLAVNAVETGAKVVDTKALAKRWYMKPDVVEKTLSITTRLASKEYGDQPRYGKYGHRLRWLSRRRLSGVFYSDTFFCISSLQGNKAVQIFANHQRYVFVAFMKGKGEAPAALRSFLDSVGLPEIICIDNAKEQTSAAWNAICREFGIKVRPTEAYKHWQNYAENAIMLIKFKTFRIMEAMNVPVFLYDHALEYTAQFSNKSYHPTYRLEGRSPHEMVLGITPDISAFMEFGFYELVFYIVNVPGKFPLPKRKIGRWLGPSKQISSDLVFKVLTKAGNIVTTSAVFPVTALDRDLPGIKQQIADFDQQIAGITPAGSMKTLAQNFGLESSTAKAHVQTLEEGKHCARSSVPAPAQVSQPHSREVASLVNQPSKGCLGQGMGCGWESARIQCGDRRGTVLRKKRDAEGEIVGTPHTNPILDTTVYQVEFDDGIVEELSAKVICDNVFGYVDDDGHQVLELDHIVEHYRGSNGWEFLVRWKDGSGDVVSLKELKESYPVSLADYVVEVNLINEEAFKWWVPHTLKKRERIIKLVKARFTRQEKFGIKIPRSPAEAYLFDRESGTNYWTKAIDKELQTVNVAFDIKERGVSPPSGYQFIKCHMIFDVKPDLTRKARFVAGGHMMRTPSLITYSSVVARDSIRILFVLAALNNLQILCTDIQGAYLYAKPREHAYFIAGDEFGPNKGCVIVIVRALYGMKSSGAAFRAKLCEDLRELGYTNSYGDPDVWMRARANEKGNKYYEYIAVYVDDLLIFSHDPTYFCSRLVEIYKLKEGFNKPTTFLGSEVPSFEGRHGEICWGLSSRNYISRVIKELEERLKSRHMFLYSHVSPMDQDYHPELDNSNPLSDNDAVWFQALVGILRWLVEIGRMDISNPVSLLSSYLACPKEGHFLAILRIFGYLKRHSSYSVVLDPSYPELVRNKTINREDWTEFYEDASEAIPDNKPPSLGQSVITYGYVDADHARDQQTRRSHTGIVLFVNSSPIVWYSKKQNSVQTSTHGAEMMATRIAVEMIESLRYKLRMFGVEIDGPTILYCDNQSVVHNAQHPESKLKKKHISISFHKIREAVAAGVVEIHKVGTTDNLADVLTKPLSGVRTSILTDKLFHKVEQLSVGQL